MKRTRVLIVEDSATARELLNRIMQDDPRLDVVGQVERGEEALVMVPRLRPDVVSMDLQLPGISGLETVRALMAEHPVPIVVVATDANRSAFEAMRAGVLSVVDKPVSPTAEGFARQARQLCDQLVLMSEVHVIRQRSSTAAPKPVVAPPVARSRRLYSMLGIGASTGGPTALAQVLGELPASFPLPVAVVQHITPGFGEGFARWLGSVCRLPTRIAQHGEIPLPGYVYLPADRHHLTVARGRLELVAEPTMSLDCPSANLLFRSMAEQVPDSLGLLLTGMGDDGAEGLLALRRAGGYTLIEDRSTAVVYGMPGAAEALDAHCESLPLHRIGPRLLELARGG